MTQELGTALILLTLFQVKHMLADFFMQTPKMLIGREVYFHAGRAQHAGVHLIGSIAALALLATPLWFVVAIVVAEWIVHFHIDWGKARFSANRGHTPADAGFWAAFGFDQTLHQLTYVVMLWCYFVWAY